MRATRWVLAAVMVASLSVACTDDPGTPSPPSTTTSAPPVARKLTLGVVGPAPQVAAFQRTLDTWDDESGRPEVEIKSWPTTTAMRADLIRGEPVPDVFMASRNDLAWLLENEKTQPVDELLDERGVEFGDNYYRDALEAFSTDDRLQCMPYGVSPKVVYYNKKLVNFDRMRERELDVPEVDATAWSFEQFTAAAEFASRPARGSKGVYVAPTIEGLGPFIRSGGGSVFDDVENPKSLAFSSDGSKGALERTLELLRNPQLTLDESELAQAPALRWFLRGKLGMLIGDRSLVPALRNRPALDFDIMPMPRLDGAATVGDVTALCLSATTKSRALAADLMVHEISEDPISIVTRAGYLQPANVAVALTDDFLQTGRRPVMATFFNTSVRSMAVAPLIDSMPALEETVGPSIEQMVFGVGVLDLDAITTIIDEQSRAILDPESLSESASPSTE